MTGCSYEGLATTATTRNQLALLTYDAAGNVTNDANGNLPTYDAENRIATVAGTTYYYDADGIRMEKSPGTMYWPGPSGALTETDLTGAINEEYVYFNGQRIARVDRPSGAVHYYFSDTLSSASVITDAVGNAQQRYFYYPYGGMQSSLGSDPNHYKFTGKERDTESNLDNFEARYYSNVSGRFITPDWAAKPTDVPYANFGNPQSLNLYSYVQNNPTTLGDPDGHCPWCIAAGVGAAVGIAAEVIADKISGQPITLRKVVAAGIGGAIIGGTLGAASGEGVAIRIALAGDAGIVGGIAERAIKTGSAEKATDLGDVGTDFATNALGEGAIQVGETLVKKAAGGAVRNLEEQASRARTTNRQQKLAGRIKAAEAKVDKKAEKVGKAIELVVETTAKTREASRDKCEGPSSGCNQPGTLKQH